MYLVRNRRELERILKAYQLVILEYFDPSRSEGAEARELEAAFRLLSKRVDGRLDVFAGRIDASNPDFKGDVKSLPMIRAYYNGQIVFEQYGGFSNSGLDYYVLTRSIFNVLERMGVSIKL